MKSFRFVAEPFNDISTAVVVEVVRDTGESYFAGSFVMERDHWSLLKVVLRASQSLKNAMRVEIVETRKA